jgi:hypothetical protein
VPPAHPVTLLNTKLDRATVSQMSAFGSVSTKYIEDWTTITDMIERKKIQNRKAQESQRLWNGHSNTKSIKRKHRKSLKGRKRTVSTASNASALSLDSGSNNTDLCQDQSGLTPMFSEALHIPPIDNTALKDAQLDNECINTVSNQDLAAWTWMSSEGLHIPYDDPAPPDLLLNYGSISSVAGHDQAAWTSMTSEDCRSCLCDDPTSFPNEAAILWRPVHWDNIVVLRNDSPPPRSTFIPHSVPLEYAEPPQTWPKHGGTQWDDELPSQKGDQTTKAAQIWSPVLPALNHIPSLGQRSESPSSLGSSSALFYDMTSYRASDQDPCDASAFEDVIFPTKTGMEPLAHEGADEFGFELRFLGFES